MIRFNETVDPTFEPLPSGNSSDMFVTYPRCPDGYLYHPDTKKCTLKHYQGEVRTGTF